MEPLCKLKLKHHISHHAAASQDAQEKVLIGARRRGTQGPHWHAHPTGDNARGKRRSKSLMWREDGPAGNVGLGKEQMNPINRKHGAGEKREKNCSLPKQDAKEVLKTYLAACRPPRRRQSRHDYLLDPEGLFPSKLWMGMIILVVCGAQS